MIRHWATWACLLLTVGCKHCRRDDAASHERAGYPNAVAPWAQPTDTGRYIGYEVGGGAAHGRKGEPPLPEEGTWGWDYHGYRVPSRVALDWWHGRKHQGGTGAYHTDGPRPLHAIETRHERRGE